MTKIITTQRLILRLFEEKDYDDLYEFLFQLRDDEFEGYPGISYEATRKHLETRIKTKEYLAIEFEGKVIGNIYAGKRLFETKEIGYIINKNYQRKGFAKEALLAVIKDEFDNGTHRLYAECDPRNTASWHLLESCDFEKEAHFKQNIYFETDKNGNPKWKDTFVYAKLNNISETKNEKRRLSILLTSLFHFLIS